MEDSTGPRVNPRTSRQPLHNYVSPVLGGQIKISAIPPTPQYDQYFPRGLRNASLNDVKQVLDRLSDEIGELKGIASNEHDRAEAEAARAQRIGRRHLILGAALGLPVGLIGSLIAWWIGIS
jgi:hypothetical protein